jgi:hypothetical protein
MSIARSVPVVPFSPSEIDCDEIADSLTPVSGSIPAELPGPEFAILDPSLPETRTRKPRAPHRVLIMLGGGTHVRTAGARLAGRISGVVPDARLLAHPAEAGHVPHVACALLEEASSRHAE